MRDESDRQLYRATDLSNYRANRDEHLAEIQLRCILIRSLRLKHGEESSRLLAPIAPALAIHAMFPLYGGSASTPRSPQRSPERKLDESESGCYRDVVVSIGIVRKRS